MIGDSRKCLHCEEEFVIEVQPRGRESQPPGQRVKDKVAWAKEILACYEPEALA